MDADHLLDRALAAAHGIRNLRLRGDADKSTGHADSAPVNVLVLERRGQGELTCLVVVGQLPTAL